MGNLLLEHLWRLPPHRDPKGILPRVLQLLVQIDEMGSLSKVCEREGLSYRHTWGLLQAGAELFDGPLADMSRGKGARLTPLGLQLIWAQRRAQARLSAQMQTLACEVSDALGTALGASSTASGTPLQVQASPCYAMQQLCDALHKPRSPLSLAWSTGNEALDALRLHQCDIAGFERDGRSGLAFADFFSQLRLDADDYMVIHLARRRLGLMTASGNPRKVYELCDLFRPGVRWTAWQDGLHPARLLNELLEREGLSADRLVRTGLREYNHEGVASAIAGGLSDAGFGLETAARRFGLEFIPLTTDSYCVAIDKTRLKQQQLKALQAILSQDAFRQTIDLLTGYDATESGHALA